jgi:phage gp29-like protein
LRCLGQNQSTEASANKASATAGLEVAKDIRDGDARLCEATINQLLRWIVDSNEGEGAPAPKFELFEQEEVDEVQAKRDKLLSDAGLRFTPAYWKRVYGLEEGDIDLTPPPPQPANAPAALPGSGPAAAGAPAASFAEPTPVDPLAPLADTLATAGDTVLSLWMAQIVKLVNSADSPAALTDALLHSYGDLPTEQLTEVMALAFAAAELKGMDAVRSEAGINSPHKP